MPGPDQSVCCPFISTRFCLTLDLARTSLDKGARNIWPSSNTRIGRVSSWKGLYARYLYVFGSCADRSYSDILAEMQLPQSGISRYETFMNSYLPDGMHYSDEEHGLYQTDQNVNAIEDKYYCAQIQLRITLNSIHNELYDKNRQSKYK